MTSRPTVVILIGSDLQHRYVAKTLAEIPNVAAIIVTQQPDVPLLRRLARARKRFGVVGMLSRITLKLTLRLIGESSRRKADLARVLGDFEFPTHVTLFRTIGVNSAETLELLRSLEPDILCIYGTYVASDATLATARQIALNLHTGISPRYRGADCEFWPLHEREPHWVGATVHTCTSNLDGGAIFGTATASLTADDGLGAVFGRCVVVGAALYKQVVQDIIIGRATNGTTQDLSAGREYRVAMRGWIAELRVAWLIYRGLIRDHPAA